MTTKTPATAHTPGPWYAGLLPNKVIARPLIGDGAIAIASVGGRTAEETIANTRLIAAAPALLAATKQLLELVEAFADDTQGAVQTGVRALLASIDGQTQEPCHLTLADAKEWLDETIAEQQKPRSRA